MPDVLDLTTPGTLWAKVQNEVTTTFHLVLAKPGYTKDALLNNPTVDPKDDLMKPFAFNFKDVGKDGLAKVDLAGARAVEIMSGLGERYERGEARVKAVKALYIARARDGNRIPKAQDVEIKEFELKTIPTITLKPGENVNNQTFVTVPNFKNGVNQFRVELTVTGPVEQIELSTDPAAQITSTIGGKANGKLVIPITEGQKAIITIPVPLVMTNRQTRQDYWDDYTAGYTLEEWRGGDIVLWARGLGAAAGLAKSVKLHAESWASGWLLTTPTYRYRHTHC
jgi:hypothetical protein